MFLKQIIDIMAEDVNTNMENLNTNLIEFFQDGILTSEEKAILRNTIS